MPPAGPPTQAPVQGNGCARDEPDATTQKMMSIDGVEGACLFKETEINVRASLRGRTYANMASAAAKFGGGGHTLAAGCTFYMPLEDAEKLFIPVLIDTVNTR